MCSLFFEWNWLMLQKWFSVFSSGALSSNGWDSVFFFVRLQHRLRVDRAPTRSYQRYLSLQWASISSHNRNRKILRRSILIQLQHVIFFLFTRWHGQPMGLSIFQIVALRNNSAIIDHYRHLYVFIVVSNSMNNLYKLYTRNWRTTNK